MTRQLWAPWRLAYVQQAGAQDECIFCRAAAAKPEDERLVVHRGVEAFVLLNRFPYASGHLMVAPVRHIAELSDLDGAEAAEVHDLTVRAVAALRIVYAPEGFNVGWNLGAAAGGSISGHLHQHVVPRWNGDTNFMPVLADIKVLPEHLDTTCELLAQAWV
jgi:ATP adenylyltransferase